MAAIVDIEGLSAGFADGPAVFRDVALSIRRGEFVCLVGASGSGKSTLLRVVAGLMAPRAGTLRLRIEPDPARRAVAMVFQEPRLLPWRRVHANVAIGLEGLDLDAKSRAARVDEALALVGLAHLRDRWPHALSGGQRQRIGIARALAVEPELLLMDEPFGALDAITRQGLQDELLRIWHETGKSVLFVTHDIDEAVYLGDRVLLLGGAPATIATAYEIAAPRPRGREHEGVQSMVTEIRAGLSNTFQDGAGI